MNKQLAFFVLFFVWGLAVSAQTIDVQHYRFALELTDENNRIKGIADILIRFTAAQKEFSLDLVQATPNEKGMKVDSVAGGNVAGFQQKNNKLFIQLRNTVSVNALDSFRVVYSGIPADGLIISKNKYGDRTFFADNWPNRAHNWIPCNDMPGDKASVVFEVTAPVNYQVISNGIQTEETVLNKNKKRTAWREDIPLPTKIMVIGAAPFAVALLDTASCIPVSAWVYPQDKHKGFYDYGLAPEIMKFFSTYIAPYPFKKLANVQSKTIFGGMENASAIFYEENSVTGTRNSENLLAHEIAHQWFGDMVTEKSFPHLWLSEGFATYLADVYLEHKYGKDEWNKRLSKEKQKVIQFSRISAQPVVDTLSGFMDLLNANSYEKGAWVLHMLRQAVGDGVFQHIIQAYYQQYKGSNADTKDFQQVAEKISGKNLDTFFQQWLYQPGIPKLKMQWNWKGNKVFFWVQQTGKTIFQFPLTIALKDAAGTQTMHTQNITAATTTFELPALQKPVQVIADPENVLLFDGTIEEKSENK